MCVSADTDVAGVKPAGSCHRLKWELQDPA